MTRIVTGAMMLWVVCGCATDLPLESGPSAVMDRATVVIEETSTSQTATLSNPGGKPLEWRHERSVPGWLIVEPRSGVVPPGGSQELTFSVSHASAPLGEHSARADFRTNEFLAPALHVDVVARIPQQRLAVLQSVTSIGYPIEYGYIHVRNAGRGTLIATLRPETSWLIMLRGGPTPTLTLRDGETGFFALRIDRSHVTHDTVAHAVIETNDNRGPIAVTIPVQGPPSNAAAISNDGN